MNISSGHQGVRRILLLGADGQAGWELHRTLSPLGEVVAASLGGEFGPTVNLADSQGLHRLIEEVKPDALVNAAAYTSVDRAERERDLAFKVNAEAPGVMGEALCERGVPIIHFSTDFVFDGAANRPYREEDDPNPLNVYGETKLAGERALLDSGANATVLRTSWLYGVRGQNFLLTMLHLFQERDELRVVDDQVGAPTWSRMLAEVTAVVLCRMLESEGPHAAPRGIFHVTGGGETSWYGFARRILESSGLSCNLRPITSSEFPAPARRPAYSVLDNSKLRDALGLVLPEWRVSLTHCLADLCWAVRAGSSSRSPNG
jgi:dTDP-4-dehydrorhamnose reductase